MLALRRMSTKKLSLYLAVIALSLGASVFMVFRNLNLGQRLFGDQPSADEPSLAEAIIARSKAPRVQSAASPESVERTPEQPQYLSRTIKDDQLDLTIFSSPKFKALVENNLLYQEKASQGKRNPFEPGE